MTATYADLITNTPSATVIEITSVEEAKAAEAAGAAGVSVVQMYNGTVPSMSSLRLVQAVKKAVTVPVIGRCRIGHGVEAIALEEAGVDFIDESEALSPVASVYIDKRDINTPCICGAENLGEALRRIDEGASIIRSNAVAYGGCFSDTTSAIRNVHSIQSELVALFAEMKRDKDEDWVSRISKKEGVREDVVHAFIDSGELPVPLFGAVSTHNPADVGLIMGMGVDGMFLGRLMPFTCNLTTMMASMTRTAYLCSLQENFSDVTGIMNACAAVESPVLSQPYYTTTI